MRRITFNIADFIENLQEVLHDNPDMIDDEVQRYKDFLERIKEPLKTDVKAYAERHPLFLENKRLRSFIKACHNPIF